MKVSGRVECWGLVEAYTRQRFRVGFTLCCGHARLVLVEPADVAHSYFHMPLHREIRPTWHSAAQLSPASVYDRQLRLDAAAPSATWTRSANGVALQPLRDNPIRCRVCLDGTSSPRNISSLPWHEA